MRLMFVAFALAVGCHSEPPPPPKQPITVERIDPSWGIPGGGTVAYVAGKNFDPKARVRVMFGQREAPMAAVLTKEKIQITIPSGIEGESATVSVSFPDGRSATVPSAFVWRQPTAKD